MIDATKNAAMTSRGNKAARPGIHLRHLARRKRALLLDDHDASAVTASLIGPYPRTNIDNRIENVLRPVIADLALRTLRLRRDEIHAGATALVQSGTKPSEILSLADLVSPKNFRCILRRRLDDVSGKENTFNYFLGKALVQIAHEWVNVDTQDLAELKRLIGKMPAHVLGLTNKNKRSLRQFDDPAVLRRLHSLPERLLAEVKRDSKPNFRTLAKAQAALAIAILSYMPLRPQNLTSLAFDTHLFMREGARATSTLELPASEVKNGKELAFDIPPHIAKMLIEYRDALRRRSSVAVPHGCSSMSTAPQRISRLWRVWSLLICVNAPVSFSHRTNFGT